ncbi:MAG: hypothetical protein FJ087_04495 [Deltaproteobacteria bacterium]|nr:hypothetical protein [Deltaproteobacteria bacterium]
MPELAEVTSLAPRLAVGHALLAVAHARAGALKEARATLANSPLPERGLPSAVQIARTELLRAGETEVLAKLGL